LVLVALGISFARHAAAEPQANAGLTVGGAAVGTHGKFWSDAEFHLGLRGDVIFLREEPYDFGIGPYLEVATLAFDELQFGGGASLHLPIHDTFPFVLSLGPYGRFGNDDFGLEPGISGALFWGSRSFNFHGNYIMAAGLSVGYRYSFGESKESALVIAAQLDLAVMGLPLVMLIDAIRGVSDDAKPIR
jgi:hypothetical protein